MALLAAGDLTAGWREYEWRWKTAQLRSGYRDFGKPLWQGEAGAGRTLLIWAEQGFGDTLQFCRFAPLAAARGWRVVMVVQKALVRLLGSLPGVDQVLPSGAVMPPIDSQCPMLSLPLALGITLDTIPCAPSYLSADPSHVAAWKARLPPLCGERLRVGLVWAGNPGRSPVLSAVDRRRSMPPELLASLLGIDGVAFFSLQKGSHALSGRPGLIDVMAEMTDFADTAALVANLDLVISVDTAVAHLASAVGTQVWMLDRFDPCWRWLTGRRDSPWYPGLRIYRQPEHGAWSAVVSAVAADLQTILLSAGSRIVD
jgi:hypothetical protein